MEKTVISVKGMSCKHCVKAVTEAVNALYGVSGVKVDLKMGWATVRYNPNTVSSGKIADAIRDLGYEAEVYTDGM